MPVKKNTARKKTNPSAREIIYGMPMEDFRRVAFGEIQEDYAGTRLLGKLASAGVDALSDYEKSVVRKLLSKLGVSQNRLRSPEVMQEAIDALVGRLVSGR